MTTMIDKPRILIGLLTAHHPSRRPYRVRAEESFLRASPLPFVWVYGDHPTDPTWTPGENELHAPGSDLKEWMVLKNQALFRYALSEGYDYCFRACDDTWVFPERIIDAQLEEYDYAGQIPCKMNIHGQFKIWFQYFNYMHGGCGIWLSRKAMEMLVANEWDGPYLKGWPSKVDVYKGLMADYSPIDWDDRWIGEVLQGRLPIYSPLRQQPMTVYAENGISVFEDDQLFLNDDPLKALSVHDPGTLKVTSPLFESLKKQIKEENMVGMAIRK